MWLYLATATSGADAKNLMPMTVGLDICKWPGPIIAMCLGMELFERLRLSCVHLTNSQSRTCRLASCNLPKVSRALTPPWTQIRSQGPRQPPVAALVLLVRIGLPRSNSREATIPSSCYRRLNARQYSANASGFWSTAACRARTRQTRSRRMIVSARLRKAATASRGWGGPLMSWKRSGDSMGREVNRLCAERGAQGPANCGHCLSSLKSKSRSRKLLSPRNRL